MVDHKSRELRVGFIGLDTSHVIRFAELLNDPAHPHRVVGARLVAGFPGGSSDFELSRSRVAEFTETLDREYGMVVETSPEAVAESVDALMLTAVDGRAHLELFRRIAPFGKPVFVDKPFAVTRSDARAIAQAAAEHRVPIMSASGSRFAGRLRAVLEDAAAGAITGADFSGPMPLQETQPGLFWYGIHTVEMLYATLGRGCREVRALSTEGHDVITGLWPEGRIGVARGNRTGNPSFCGLVHRTQGTQTVANLRQAQEPFHRPHLEAVLQFFRTGQSPVPVEETLEIIAFIEAANASRSHGHPVAVEI